MVQSGVKGISGGKLDGSVMNVVLEDDKPRTDSLASGENVG